jgi:peroxiredoxin
MSLRRLFLLPTVLLAVSLPSVAATPGVGQRAPDFTLSTPNGERLSLSSLTGRSNVVLSLLRGYPGYQCPFSQQQFQLYEQAAATFASSNTEVLFVYPGTDSKNLAEDAINMTGSVRLPGNIHVVIDPNYDFTNKYGLRWNEPNQTAYPTTFVLDRTGMVFFAHRGRTSSDQTPATLALAAINANTTAKKD